VLLDHLVVGSQNQERCRPLSYEERILVFSLTALAGVLASSLLAASLAMAAAGDAVPRIDPTPSCRGTLGTPGTCS